MPSINEKLLSADEALKNLMRKIKFDMRVSSPGIIKSFDSAKQTVEVQITILEKVVIDGKILTKKIPILADVPIFMPRAGNFIITMPIAVGDECLVIFSDTCYDAWFQSGGEENVQMDGRRHDLSDAFALCGIWSQPNVISNYSEDSIQIRNESGTSCIEIKDSEITINTSSQINIETDGAINIESSGNTEIKSTGTMTIESQSIMDITSTGAMSIESQGIVDIKSSGVTNIDGTMVNIGGMTGQPVARVGDDVNVLTGKIISGSAKVKAG